MVLLIWALACHKQPEVPVPPPAPMPAPAPVETGRDALIRALSMRDGEPSCAVVEALVPEPVPALIEIVETVTLPPMVPMRAANCLLVGHAEASADALDRWMTSESTRGLAMLVLQRFDSLPAPVAARLAASGLAGPHAADVRPVVEASVMPEVRALLATP